MIPLTKYDFQWGHSEVVIIYPDLYTHDNYWISDEYHLWFTIHVGHCIIQLWEAPSPGSSFILWVPHLRGTIEGPNRSLSEGSTHEQNMKSLSSCPVPRIPSDCFNSHSLFLQFPTYPFWGVDLSFSGPRLTYIWQVSERCWLAFGSVSTPPAPRYWQLRVQTCWTHRNSSSIWSCSL